NAKTRIGPVLTLVVFAIPFSFFFQLLQIPTRPINRIPSRLTIPWPNRPNPARIRDLRCVAVSPSLFFEQFKAPGAYRSGVHECLSFDAFGLAGVVDQKDRPLDRGLRFDRDKPSFLAVEPGHRFESKTV